MEPKQVDLEPHVDDRGHLYQILGDYEFPQVERAYIVGNFEKGTIRGYHMHKEEWKSYFVTSGAAKFVVAQDETDTQAFVISDRNPSVLIVPPDYYHGWKSLQPETQLIGFSNKTLEESIDDDFRKDPYVFGEKIWEVEDR